MNTPFTHPKRPAKLNVVLFSGGRGSKVLSRELINNPRIDLTLAINGYDDGASTGEVRRFLGDALGPSDFRKNASRLATEIQSCSSALVDLLDLRFPVQFSTSAALASLRMISGSAGSSDDCEFQARLRLIWDQIAQPSRTLLSQKLRRFEQELLRTQRPISFSDCSLGNLVFAGCFLEAGGDFNQAVDEYCAILNLPPGLIENVTDGRNAYLVALDRNNRLVASEADIVNAKARNYIKEIYLIDHRLTEDEQRRLSGAAPDELAGFLQQHSVDVQANPRLIQRIAKAHLIIYSPGTQHSSLFPSYMTSGVGQAIAKNLTAIKLLITNLQEDAEIPDTSAVDIIEKAVRYLKGKDSQQIPTPCLITHYLINDGNAATNRAAYIPVGQLDTLEDPRLIRIGNYEEGITGCHDAARVLTPFIESIVRNSDLPEIAVLMMETSSLNKICQSILELLRGGGQDLAASLTVLYCSEESFDSAFAESLPFKLVDVYRPHELSEASLLRAVVNNKFDYVVLFDSSGMYRGEDIVGLISPLCPGKLDAVWGSRRLSVKEIHQSYKFRYRHNVLLGAISYVGSHLLSLAYLVLYGRYISDTLSGARAVRATYLLPGQVDLGHKCLNQQMLSMLLADRAEVFETPVQFIPLSPEKVKRTTVLDGLRSLLTAFRLRLKPVRKLERSPAAGAAAATTARPVARLSSAQRQ